MKYVKHPTLGNRHVTEAQALELEAAGWVRFPRSKEAKALGAWPPLVAAPRELESVIAPVVAPEPVGAAPDIGALRAELDARGVKYHHRAGAEKLRALLETA